MAIRLATAVAIIVALAAAKAVAGTILTVTGAAGDPAATRVISEEEFHSFPTMTYATRTDYTDGPTMFTGPLAREVLGEETLRGASVAVMTAANDFAVEIPASDLVRYDVIFATRVNGRRLSRRDKGPIWVMYPLDRHQELQNSAINSRLIWQLERLELR